MAQTASTALVQPLPLPSIPWFDSRTGRPTLEFGRWATALDAVMRGGLLGTLTNAANDGAAAAAGVPLNGLYRNGSVVQIRVT